MATQADRLNAIIEDLLALSKIEQSERAADLVVEEVAIRDMLQAVLHDCQSKAAQREIQVRVDCDDSLLARINAPLLEQAVTNLLDNALKYSEPGSEVLITAVENNAEVTIAVSDHGCGIDDEHLPRLFERFYRVDKAPEPQIGGHRPGTSDRQAYRSGSPRPDHGRQHARRRERLSHPFTPFAHASRRARRLDLRGITGRPVPG